MRYLGIDYGEKRIGVALTDEGGRMAFPYGIISHDAKIFRRMRELCEKEAVGKIVLGLPLDLQGRETAMTKQARDFGHKLREETGLEIILQNEMLSTKEAEHFQGHHAKIDASAAALILDSYLKKG
ncbi:MAG: Holliday junction resolvase RuvX [Candidatus Niyogibacteria bacterium]|nr:Holliday junction resolvase RuvX [Candidatus Niyogibacteria bacterium]